MVQDGGKWHGGMGIAKYLRLQYRVSLKSGRNRLIHRPCFPELFQLSPGKSYDLRSFADRKDFTPPFGGKRHTTFGRLPIFRITHAKALRRRASRVVINTILFDPDDMLNIYDFRRQRERF